MAGKTPDYIIRALNKETGERGDIGAGWKEDGGRISIAFNPFVVVPVGKKFTMSLFPNEGSRDPKVEKPSHGNVDAPGNYKAQNDIPF